jgi:peptidoglycan/LPS O-acetylase OafA/YrhL
MMIRSFDKSDRGWWHCARDFWLRRWFRTIPNYYLFIGINVCLVIAGIAPGKISPSYFIFSQNLAWEENPPHFFGESWSLALDEWFYLILPIGLGVISLLSVPKKHGFVLASGLLIILPTLGRALHPQPSDFYEWDAQIRRITIYHLDATGWGVLAAVASKWYPDWWRARLNQKAFLGCAVMASGLSAVIALTHPELRTAFELRICAVFSISLMNIGTFLLLPWITQKIEGLKFFRLLTSRLSDYSYSIYLAHFPLIYLFLYCVDVNPSRSAYFMGSLVVAWIGATAAVSALIFHSFEKPVANLRERFTKRVNASPF